MNFRARRFDNDICKACIAKNVAKYGTFDVKCDGITVEDDVKFAIKQGYTEEDARWAFDPVFFFDTVYGSPARAYQKPQLLCTARRIVGRQCRQSGKSLAYIYKVLHYLITNENKTVLVIAPFEKLLKKLWDEYVLRDCLHKHAKTKASIVSKAMSPSYNILFDNGSRLIMMIAGEGARGQTADWIYIDEAAIIPPETLNSIVFTIASRGDGAAMLLTSTPKGRGNMFYKACKEDSNYNEYHVSIYDIPEMANQIPEFRKVSGEAGFEQECVAEFPDGAGGPFSYKGIDLAKQPYLYENCFKESNYIYFGGVDWNGPGVGTYFYVIGFDPNSSNVKVVDKSVVASNTWNSTVAKNEFIRLNRKWGPKHWMCDAGYGHSIMEDLRLYSTQIRQNNTPDAQIKYTLEPVAFGEWLKLNDPFTKEEIKKTTKSFVVSQLARLFEPAPGGDGVRIAYSSDDNELTQSLEMYKLLATTSKGVEQYGLDKKDGVEDHCIDALMLSVYGIVKYYGELFKRIIYQSVGFNARDILTPPVQPGEKMLVGSIILLTDNSPEPIYLDDKSISRYDPEMQNNIVVSRGFDGNNGRKSGTLSGIMARRGTTVRRNFD
ncbi:MAG: terminase family protein [Candidatus Cloacimonetes bacterium]|nr:terminase family protein [Candidatus Cloacimonadota bacterium]